MAGTPVGKRRGCRSPRQSVRVRDAAGSSFGGKVDGRSSGGGETAAETRAGTGAVHGSTREAVGSIPPSC